MRTVATPDAFDAAWSEQYLRLAREFQRRLPEGTRTLIDLGCGRGQLTIPLAKLEPGLRIIGVDLFAPPYVRSGAQLRSALARHRLKSRFRCVRSDCLNWLPRRRSRTSDAVISNEFLGELDAVETMDVLAECYRILKPGGVTIHGFLSPVARNSAQQLMIQANVSPRWSKTPPKMWLSPPPDLVVRFLEEAGFRCVRSIAWRSGLRVKGRAARDVLARWNTREAFWDRHNRRLTAGGFEIPDWVLVSGQKARSTLRVADRG